VKDDLAEARACARGRKSKKNKIKYTADELRCGPGRARRASAGRPWRRRPWRRRRREPLESRRSTWEDPRAFDDWREPLVKVVCAYLLRCMGFSSRCSPLNVMRRDRHWGRCLATASNAFVRASTRRDHRYLQNSLENRDLAGGSVHFLIYKCGAAPLEKRLMCRETASMG